MVSKVRASELLKPHLDYYDRLPASHVDKTYDWVSQLIDTLVSKERQRRNTQSLVLEASGKDQAPQPPKKSALAASHQQVNQETVAQDAGESPTQGGGQPARRKGNKGGGAQSAGGPTPGATPHGSPRGLKGIPNDSRCCIKHLWSRCTNPLPCCFGPHLDKPTDAIKEHKFYQTMLKDHGEPTGPKQPEPTEAGAGSAAGS